MTVKLSINTEVDYETIVPHVVRLSSDDMYWIIGLSNGVIDVRPTFADKSQHIFSLFTKDEILPCTDASAIISQKVQKQYTVIAVYASGFVRLWSYTAFDLKVEKNKNINRPAKLLFEWCEEKWNPMLEEMGDRKARPFEANQLLALSSSTDGQRFVTGGTDGRIRVYNTKTCKLITLCESSLLQERMDGHTERISALMYHPRGKTESVYEHIFLSGGWDNSIQIWDDRYIRSIWQYFGPHISGNDALDIEPEANQIISASWKRGNEILQVWAFNDIALGTFFETGEIQPITGSLLPTNPHLVPFAEVERSQFEPPTSGYVARWIGSRYMVYGGSDENILKIIDKNTLNTIASLDKFSSGVVSVAITKPLPDEKQQRVKLAIASGHRVYFAHLDCVFD